MKNKFTERELKSLGFKRNFEPKENSGYYCDYSYYTLDFSKGGSGCLISNCFEGDIKEVTVELFEEDGRELSREFVLACAKEFKK